MNPARLQPDSEIDDLIVETALAGRPLSPLVVRRLEVEPDIATRGRAGFRIGVRRRLELEVLHAYRSRVSIGEPAYVARGSGAVSDLVSRAARSESMLRPELKACQPATGNARIAAASEDRKEEP